MAREHHRVSTDRHHRLNRDHRRPVSTDSLQLTDKDSHRADTVKVSLVQESLVIPRVSRPVSLVILGMDRPREVSRNMGSRRVNTDNNLKDSTDNHHKDSTDNRLRDNMGNSRKAARVVQYSACLKVRLII